MEFFNRLRGYDRLDTSDVSLDESSDCEESFDEHRTENENVEVSFRVVKSNDAECSSQFPTNIIINSKYTLLTFLPYNMYEQFRSFMNRYFLLVACLQLFPALTAVNPLTTWVPLIIIFLITGVKDGYDDYVRHKNDKLINRKRNLVIRNGVMQEVFAQDIHVGDILKIQSDYEMPCDVVLLKVEGEHHKQHANENGPSASSADGREIETETLGRCFVQTANLDGETDFKLRFTPPKTNDLSIEDLQRFSGVVECADPNADIYKFDSRLKIENDVIPINLENSIWQGMVIRNVNNIFGLVVYTGNETKLGMNKHPPYFKITKLDQKISKTSSVVFFCQLFVAIILGVCGYVWDRDVAYKHFYLGGNEGKVEGIFIFPIRMLLLMSFTIPISLKVTLDFFKLFYSFLIEWDLEMYSKTLTTFAKATNTQISEDLGQIEYLLTDKTGTLTNNEMKLKACSVDCTIYIGIDKNLSNMIPKSKSLTLNQLYENYPYSELNSENFHSDEKRIAFFRVLAICHSINISVNEFEEVIYEGQSPDEIALVTAAANAGVSFFNRIGNIIELKIDGSNIEKWEILETFPFTSDRKMMSVVARKVDGYGNSEVVVFTKGAEDVVFGKCNADDLVTKTSQHVEHFAQCGLRVLGVATRTVNRDQVKIWKEWIKKAKLSIDGRENELQKCYKQIEKEFQLLGATAIEDSLQDYVPEAISKFRDAGVHIWMLTGDKVSTAVEIARSCRLLKNEDKVCIIEGDCKTDVVNSVTALTNKCSNATAEPYVVVVDGETLKKAIKSCSSELIDLCLDAACVLCCRISPKQKALMVKYLKDRNKLVAAVGDGGNDVSMIQEADIGVGIIGKEGLQAARAADFSIGEFRFLLKLFLVHGRYSYKRTCFAVLYSFHKSLFLVTIQVVFQLFNGFSGASFFDGLELTLYNVIFTGAPVFLYAFDMDINMDILIQKPFYYKDTQEGKGFTFMVFLSSQLLAIYQALVVFCITMSVFDGTNILTNGKTHGQQLSAFAAYITGVTVQTTNVLMSFNIYTKFNLLCISLQYMGVFVFFVLLGLVEKSDKFQMIQILGSQPSFWFMLVASIWCCIFPVLVKNMVSRMKENSNSVEQENNQIFAVDSGRSI